MTRELPEFLRDMLASPPRAGEGFHNYLYRLARQLHAHCTALEIFALLKSLAANCGRHVSDTEIWDAIKNSMATAWQPRDTSATTASAPTPRKWPEVNQDQRAAVIRDNGGLADLWEVSPVRIEDNASDAELGVDALFR